MWQPLLQYLSESTDTTVTLQITREYNELALRMKNGQFDIGVFPPLAYVNAKDQMPQLKYVATLLKPYADGRIADHYKGVLITLKSSNIANLEDLRNKRFAFTSTSSTSGYLYPNAFLKRRHIDAASYFSQIFMLKRHSKVVKALLSQAIDGGATTDEQLYLAQQQYGDIFNIIAQTSAIPFDALTIAPHVSPQLQQRITQKIKDIQLRPDLLQRLKKSQWRYSGFINKDDRFYDSVRQVRDTLQGTVAP